ncbi:MAG: DUF1801 domain-containing protein [Nocardioides sp.]|jgi:uncharacterized protein YdhG (YjbR/CyaY superfamily)
MSESVTPVEDYLRDLPEDRAAVLRHLRDVVYEAYPTVTEKVSYGMPTFVVDGHAIGGFLSHQGFMSWYPHSGTTLSTVAEQTQGRKQTKSALHFTVDDPLPDDLVRDLLATRAAEWS